MYHLEVLNDKEFEELAKDLLEIELKIPFQNFNKGKDKGIDLRYSNYQENKIVVQVKHYISSKFSNLKYNLSKKELPKIKSLAPLPERYILVTSLSLNPMQVDEIREILSPFIKDTNDIYGRDRIQSLITCNPKIEEKYLKLWLSSTNILKRILNNSIIGRSQFHEKKILRKLSHYVPTQNLKDAIDILKEKKFVIITGEPGVGKTTISYLIICTLLSQNFKLIFVDDSLKDAETLISEDPQEKQVIFFDDFLGSNIYEIMNPRNTESSILGFIDRIQSLKKTYLILTTRTTILNQAEHNFEKLRRLKLRKISEYQVQLKQYSKLDRAKILYNHLYYSTLPNDYLDLFWSDRNYLKIIEHRNYSPRLIEFITSNNHLPKDKSEYLNHIFKSLDCPNEIWQSAFETQLADDDRFLLLTIFSLGGSNIPVQHLEKAFEQRLKFEINNNGHKRTINAFKASLKRLLDGFISSEKRSHELITVRFINPSVADFLIAYLKESNEERLRILKSAHYVEQFLTYFSANNAFSVFHKNLIKITEQEINELFDYFVRRASSLESIHDKYSKEIEILRIYMRFFENLADKNNIAPYVSNIRAQEISKDQFTDLVIILEIYSDDEELNKVALKKFKSIVLTLYQFASDSTDFENLFRLFTIFKINFEEFLADKNNSEIVFESAANCVTEYFRDSINSSLEERVIKSELRCDRQTTRTIISEAYEDELYNFLSDARLEEYFDSINAHSEIYEDDIIEMIMENSSEQPEENFPDNFFYTDRSRSTSFNQLSKAKSDSEKIIDLFE